ncbi:HIT-type Zinc finger family protein isoform 1 [Hibiscus syriacus]|uniref:HIT-type Zinc finger family protein isoform 1 n=1 Tax=Hibiscus syriacus TaxID=106335 RepID=A0A6A3B2F5_HIBSY|nr:cation/H(+) antiporter 24-like [Hibiscus syriacus]KAE8711214.1 HIT-type Zinc finger family protein isoform 1 [Hibiscus syriacus]
MGIARGAKFQLSNRGTAALPLRCSRSQISNPFSIFYEGKPIKFSFNVILVALILTIIISRTAQILLKPLRQPRLVSDMIGGIIMGPSLMARSPMFVSMVFPLSSEFLLKNLGLMGLMLFLFVSGVKMDIGLLTRSGRKQICIAVAGVFAPLIVVTVVAFCTRKSMDVQLARFSSTGAIASSMAVTTFPIQYVVLQELNLLSSDVGIMALSTALISDSFGFNFISAFEAMKQSEVSTACALWYLLSTFVFVVFLLGSAHQAMLWIIRKTPEGQPVDQIYVITIFLSVFVFGFLSDMFGLAICNGSFWLGLVIPSGPPLGATLVEKSETIMMEVLMPCTYVFFGLNTDFYAMQEAGWSALSPLFGLIISGYLTKFLSTLLAARMVDLSWRESLAVSLVLSLRGQVELILYYHWVDKDIIGVAGFTMLMYATAILMGIITPMISILYDPSKPYMVSQRRTIQHTAPNDHLRILVCIKDKEHLQSIVNLLQVSYPTAQNPFSIHVFHHVDFIGRGNPLFIDHQKQEFGELASRFPDWERIQNALTLYQEGREDCVDLQFFSASTAKITMYQEVCKLALESNSVIIILPLEKKCDGEIAAAEQWGGGKQSVIIQVLENAPCSVGLLVDKAERRQLPQEATHGFIVLFLGGPDSREALSYSGRMAGNPRVSLTVVRFLSSNGEGDDEMQKKLDDGVVTSFWVQNERNERVSYRELVVRNGADTVAAILEMAKEKYYDMWIVGRKQGINQSLLEGLSTWTENQEELGIMGDYVSSSESVNADSVLVIQKQVLRGNTTTSSSTVTTSRWWSLFR